MLTIAELKNEAKKFLKDTYDLELSVPVLINRRMKATFGTFKFRYKRPLSVEMSYNFVKSQEDEKVLDVLRHELVHYACFTLGKPYNDGSKHFEGELRRLGVCSTKTYTYKGKAHQYKCTSCEKGFTKRRQMPINKETKFTLHHRCGDCDTVLLYEGETTIE